MLSWKDVLFVLRVALTGQAVGIGLYDTMAILGKDKCIAHIRAFLRGTERDA